MRKVALDIACDGLCLDTRYVANVNVHILTCPEVQYILLHQKDTIHIREYMTHHPYDHVLPFYKSQVSQ